MKVIYDIGANNGDNLPYYLLKADKVVAVEANPILVEAIQHRFASEINADRIVVEPVVVTCDSGLGIVPFYINHGIHQMSQIAEPTINEVGNFSQVDLPSRALVDIVIEHGHPFYIKIDVEGHDHFLLNSLFSHDIFPPYLSAESHLVEVFATFVANGGYDSFKIVDGSRVQHVYGNHAVETEIGPIIHKFPAHCAGPFGNDIIGHWQNAATFLHTLARHGLGWKDIHGSRVDSPIS